MQAQLFLDCQNELGEGPLWHDNKLCWLNILGGSLFSLASAGGPVRSRSVSGMLGAAAPTQDGRWLLGTEAGLVLLDWESGAVTPFADPASGLSRMRFNDGKADARGRFWTSLMHIDAREGTGSLWSIDVDGRPTPHLDGLTIPNGMAWTAGGSRFFFIDTPTRRIDRFDFDPDSGTLHNRETAFDFSGEKGDPDGMCVDAEDCLWVAMWGGAQVIRVDPQRGKVLRRIPVPVSQPTSCCFGGPSMSTLFITSARIGLSPKQLRDEPKAGSLFSLETETHGFPASRVRLRHAPA